MINKEIPTNIDFEIINVQPMNDFISDCEIKVFYHGKNRNGSYISKAVGTEIANTLPKSPIVAFYNEAIDDYEDHGQEMVINRNGVKFISKTVPYGAVSENTPIVWKKFVDKDGIEREYLVCRGFLWTGRYPHLNSVLENSKGQSMEFFPESINGDWAKFENEDNEFFIFNEASISALCILGDDVEPCFEGASVGKPEVLYSLKKDEFKQEFNNFMLELNKVLTYNLKEGGKAEVIEETQNFELDENNESIENFVAMEDLKSKPALKMDKTIEKMSERPWGDVDKAQLVKDIMMAENFETIVDDVYMLLEDGWQDGLEGACKYPVMELQGDTLVYNRYGLSSGLAYANRLGEETVANKIVEIARKLNIEGYENNEMELDMEDENYVCKPKKKKFEMEEENSDFAAVEIKIEISGSEEGTEPSICEVCGSEMPEDCGYCPQCGVPTEEPIVEPITEEYIEVPEELIDTEDDEEILSESEMIDILKQKIVELQAECDLLQEKCNLLSDGYYQLQEINKQKEIDAKNEICEKFSILGDEIINSFKSNFDQYTVEEIDEKLSAIAFKKGINFNVLEDNKDGIITPTPQPAATKNVPAWLQAVEERVKNK